MERTKDGFIQLENGGVTQSAGLKELIALLEEKEELSTEDFIMALDSLEEKLVKSSASN